MGLYLAKPTIDMKDDLINYIEEFYIFNSNINGVGGLDRYLNDYDGWLKKLDADEVIVPTEERVPGLTRVLIREEDNRIIGMVNIRLVLNKKLKHEGGHIGYSIRPTERRQGYGKVNLYLALLICKEHNIPVAQVDCDSINIGSKKTIEALGGILQREFYCEPLDCNALSYNIDVEESIKKYKKVYEPLIRS